MRPHKKALNAYPGHDGRSRRQFVIERPAGLRQGDRLHERLGAGAAGLEQLLMVRYEDLRRDTTASFGESWRSWARRGPRTRSGRRSRSPRSRTCRRWRPGGLSGRAVACCPAIRTTRQSFKVRRGKVGGYRDDFTAAESRRIDALVQAELDPVFGYGAAGQPAQAASA